MTTKLNTTNIDRPWVAFDIEDVPRQAPWSHPWQWETPRAQQGGIAETSYAFKDPLEYAKVTDRSDPAGTKPTFSARIASGYSIADGFQWKRTGQPRRYMPGQLRTAMQTLVDVNAALDEHGKRELASEFTDLLRDVPRDMDAMIVWLCTGVTESEQHGRRPDAAHLIQSWDPDLALKRGRDIRAKLTRDEDRRNEGTK